MRKWVIELLEAEGRCAASLYYQQDRRPPVVWDVVHLPHLADSPSEHAILDELYGVLLQMMENSGMAQGLR